MLEASLSFYIIRDRLTSPINDVFLLVTIAILSGRVIRWRRTLVVDKSCFLWEVYVGWRHKYGPDV